MNRNIIAIEYCYTPEQIEKIKREAVLEERRKIKRNIERKWKSFLDDVKLTIGTFSFIIACAIVTWILL